MNSRGEVIDYRQLDPREITLFLNYFKEIIPNDTYEELKEKMNGVDGRNVTSLEDLIHPGPDIIKPEEGENR